MTEQLPTFGIADGGGLNVILSEAGKSQGEVDASELNDPGFDNKYISRNSHSMVTDTREMTG